MPMAQRSKNAHLFLYGRHKIFITESKFVLHLAPVCDAAAVHLTDAAKEHFHTHTHQQLLIKKSKHREKIILSNSKDKKRQK